MKWDKGNAAIYILKTAFGIHWSDNIRVIFAGDDLTDEDAMKALKVRKSSILIASLVISYNFKKRTYNVYLISKL